ncbi:hypothetical protein [Cognatilysobacter segetis]|uniref:hypothetical protein n=1 Tax=Cognatilysobacter segetis TaxID=2492394 RepID=UPI00105D619B|nr:hypothetical protein [Lysobacter segetis]
MNFDLYRRADQFLIVVPLAPRPPYGLMAEGKLRRVGSASFAMSTLSPDLAHAIALRGYGLATRADEVIIEGAMHVCEAAHGSSPGFRQA